MRICRGVSHPKKPACGPHVELVKNEGARITRCPCGTLHLHLARSGVTVQLADESFDELADANAEAKRELRPQPARPSVVVDAPQGTGEFLSVQIPFASDKKLN
jgi:hypothetical protein